MTDGRWRNRWQRMAATVTGTTHRATAGPLTTWRPLATAGDRWRHTTAHALC